jgi:hypothetical protein
MVLLSQRNPYVAIAWGGFGCSLNYFVGFLFHSSKVDVVYFVVIRTPVHGNVLVPVQRMPVWDTLGKISTVEKCTYQQGV